VPRTDCTRYIDTLTGPRKYTELAPDLARAVEEVCAQLAQVDPRRLTRYLAALAAADNHDYRPLENIWAERLRA
jgi:hypothetical protein